MKIKIAKLSSEATLPTREYDTDAGLDLYALEKVEIYPGETVQVRTGIALQLPEEWNTELTVGMAHIEDRSSLGGKGLHHTAGVVDHGYNKGEILVFITNLNIYNVLNSLELTKDLKITFDFKPYVIEKGKKFAQVVLQPVYKGEPTEVWLEELENRERGAKGFGSSGE